MARLKTKEQLPLGDWSPLLTGSLAERALGAIHDIAADLGELGNALLEHEGRRQAVAVLADRALVLAYAGIELGEPSYRRIAERLLDEVAERFADSSSSPALYGGYSGVALAVSQTEHALAVADGSWPDPPADDAASSIDGALLDLIAAPTASPQHDLVSGLCGFGAYFLHRPTRRSARQGVERVVQRLSALSETTGDGITWFNHPAHLPAWRLEEAPNGYYDLGVAHGVPGLIVFLALAVANGLGGAEAERLLEGAVSWTLSQRQDETEVGALFPSWTYPGREPSFCRLAWCYGDAGVGGALLNASRLVGREDWERAAREILAHAGSRRNDAAGVADAGLCHGASGLGHIFHLAYRFSGEARFSEAALFWFERALSMRAPIGVGGFWSHQPLRPDASGEYIAVDDPITPDSSFLTGSAGVGLALLTALTGRVPTWDHRLLLSQGLLEEPRLV